MPCSTKFPVTLQTEIRSTETSDFLKQIIFLKSFNSVFAMRTKWLSAYDVKRSDYFLFALISIWILKNP